MRRIGGARRKTRSVMRKNFRQKGKLSIRRFFQKFKVGDSVHLIAEPAYQQGMYDIKFYGRVARVTGTQGRCYTVSIKEGGVTKSLIVHPVHLKKRN